MQENNNGESSNGRKAVLEIVNVGSTPTSPSKLKRREYMRKYQKEWYMKNSRKTIERTNQYRKELKEWFAKIVSELECVECGEDHPGCLDFHHRDPALKDKEVATMVAQKRTKAAILKEISKCDVLCANCHRKLHYEERKLRANDV